MSQEIYKWEVPYVDSKGENRVMIQASPHRRGAERGVPGHYGTARLYVPPKTKKASKGKAKA